MSTEDSCDDGASPHDGRLVGHRACRCARSCSGLGLGRCPSRPTTRCWWPGGLGCGVCRTDLHLAEGDSPPHRPGACPATRSSGEVVEPAPAPTGSASATGSASPGCAGPAGLPVLPRGAREPLPAPRFTGWDADGGYAEYAVVPTAFAYRAARRARRRRAAPLLCAGIIGYRALRRPRCRPAGGSASTASAPRAHLAAQVALAEGAEVHVMTRSRGRPRLALELGAASVGDAVRRAPGRWTRPSSSPPSATSCPSRSRARPGRHARHRRHPPQRRPAAATTRRDCSTNAAAQRHRQHPGATARSSWPWPAPACGLTYHAATQWTPPTGRWPTWPRTGSTARPCST